MVYLAELTLDDGAGCGRTVELPLGRKPFGNVGFDVVLGMELISRCVLRVDGLAGTFTLEYPAPEKKE